MLTDNHSPILQGLKESALRRASELSPESVTIRGVWRSEYVLRLTDQSSVLRLHYVVVQTLGQGCSYFDPVNEDPGLSEALLGQSALDLRTGYRCLEIAALDAVYSDLISEPDETFCLDGSNITKAAQRAEIVYRTTLKVIRQARSSGRKARVTMVGVVGEIAAQLAAHPDITLSATDYYAGIVGETIAGTRVEHGSQTLALVADSDVAIVTGMTLANNTLDGIIDVSMLNDTQVVLFAETGANFAAEYCKLGLAAVVSEPLPFYLTGDGPTRISVYLRKS